MGSECCLMLALTNRLLRLDSVTLLHIKSEANHTRDIETDAGDLLALF